MNGAHLHLVLNHFPLIATACGLVLLAWGRLARSADLHQGALGLFVVGALLTAPTYLTGDPAEDVVKGLSGVSEPRIEEHEEAATAAAVAIAVLGALALASLVMARRGRPVPKPLTASVILLALMTAALMGRAANLGGQIRHEEIRPGAPAPRG